jgi:hypothetical protein
MNSARYSDDYNKMVVTVPESGSDLIVLGLRSH